MSAGGAKPDGGVRGARPATSSQSVVENFVRPALLGDVLHDSDEPHGSALLPERLTDNPDTALAPVGADNRNFFIEGLTAIDRPF